MTEIVATLGYHGDRPERLALIRPDGSVSNWFGQGETREDIAAILASAGLAVREDDTVVRA